MPDMRFAVNGITVAAKVEGNPAAPCVVLLHGFPDSSKLWNAQVWGDAYHFDLMRPASVNKRRVS